MKKESQDAVQKQKGSWGLWQDQEKDDFQIIVLHHDVFCRWEN